MSADKTKAEVLADKLDAMRDVDFDATFAPAADALRRIPALEAERDTYRARLDRAIAAAEKHFGEDAIRYKLSLFQNGRARNVFQHSMDGKWFAFQRADNDAHIGLSLRVVEAEAERDQLRAELAARKEADTRSTIAAWDQIKRLQGEAYVLRDLLAEARAVLDTIIGTDQEDGGAALSKLTAAIGVALDPTRREAQQMYITEASKEAT